MPGEYIQSALFELKRRTFFGQFSFVTTEIVGILFFFSFSEECSGKDAHISKTKNDQVDSSKTSQEHVAFGISGY